MGDQKDAVRRPTWQHEISFRIRLGVAPSRHLQINLSWKPHERIRGAKPICGSRAKQDYCHSRRIAVGKLYCSSDGWKTAELEINFAIANKRTYKLFIAGRPSIRRNLDIQLGQ